MKIIHLAFLLILLISNSLKAQNTVVQNIKGLIGDAATRQV